jgi:hypothetical protein
MKTLALMVGLWMAFVVAAYSQVTVSVVLEQDQFLRNETLPVRVRILNSSGQTLEIGQSQDWLVFQIQDSEGHDVRQLDKVPLADPFKLEASKVANLSIDLLPYFEISKIGRYTLTTALRLDQLGGSFTSPPKGFDVIAGTKLWEREFGLPATGVPEVRKYALVQANFLKHLRLYVRITDPLENRVFRVVPLGQLLSFSKPEALLDKSSNLHVLFQNTARAFFYLVITPDGELIIRQTYHYKDGSRPSLRHDEEQGIHITGGERRVLLTDLPPPPDEVVPPLQTPPPTNAPATNPPPAQSRKSKQGRKASE